MKRFKAFEEAAAVTVEKKKTHKKTTTLRSHLQKQYKTVKTT